MHPMLHGFKEVEWPTHQGGCDSAQRKYRSSRTMARSKLERRGLRRTGAYPGAFRTITKSRHGANSTSRRQLDAHVRGMASFDCLN